MILNVRGTSGSGKSTLIRKIMDLALNKEPVYLKSPRTITRKSTKKNPNPKPRIYKRTFPLFYRFDYDNCRITIPGHYESPCGGCDNIPTYEILFEIIRTEHELGNHVLFEGLLVAHDKMQTLKLWDHLKREPGVIQILELTDPLEVCLQSVEKRRSERENPATDEFNPTNTVRRYYEVIRSCKILEAEGIPIHRYPRDIAPEIIAQLFKLPVRVAV